MNALLTGLMTKLTGSALATQVGSRIYLDEAPEGVAFPYVVFFIVVSTPLDNFKTKLDDVLIATDDERIADACKAYDMRYLMTSPDHDTPTGRIWEVSTVEDADLYLQLMGDEPLVNPAAFDLILPDTLPDDPYYVAVLTNIMEHPADVIDFSNQKVVTNAAREILLISRSPIPYPKGTLDFEYEKVTGIQLYSKQALKFYHDTPKSILEKAEENDMMRFIENGHKVHAIVSPYKTVSVDTPKDLALVNEILKEKQHG